MEVRILTGSGANSGYLTDFHRTLDKLKDTKGMLTHVVRWAIMPALKRNWANSGIKSHEGNARKAVTDMGAAGNVVEVDNTHATVTYNKESLPYIEALIDGRKEVYPKRAKVLVWNQQYGVNLKYRKYSRTSKSFPLYYLVPTDEAKINEAIDEWIQAESKV